MELKILARQSGRLSHILKEELKISTGLMNRLKWQNLLLVNGVPRHTDYPVAAGDTVSLTLQEPPANYPAQEGSLSVLYEDRHFLAVDKPAGMLIHPSRSQNTDTLANFVLGYYAAQGEAAAFHPITRLDRDTFGVVLLAKHSHAHALLQTAPFEKTYHALVYGTPLSRQGRIDAPIARCPLPSLLRKIEAGGKKSITEYSLLWSKEGISKLSLIPITGRTHQLRLHCAHMGFPILGDPQYGTAASQALSRQFGYTTQQLCAKKICFLHPLTGEKITLTSQLDTPNPY